MSEFLLSKCIFKYFNKAGIIFKISMSVVLSFSVKNEHFLIIVCNKKVLNDGYCLFCIVWFSNIVKYICIMIYNVLYTYRILISSDIIILIIHYIIYLYFA